MKRVAIYLRVSSDKQAKEGDSIPAQHEALTSYIKEHGYELVGEYIDDGISGTKYSERDELQRLLKDVQDDKIDLVLVTKLDRLFRSIRYYVNTQVILDKHHVDWLAIWEPIYDTSTPAGRLIVNQMMSIAQFEAENTGQRIRQVQAYKVKQREVISGNVTPGYSIKDKHMVPNEDAADVVRAFDIFNRTGSLRETLRALEGSNLPTTCSGLKNLLSRSVYIGEAHGLTDFCPPIVDRDTFESVQRQLSINVKCSQKHTYLFSGLLKCGECKRVMAGLTRRRERKGGTTESYMYRCARHYQRAIKTCPNAKIMYENVLERYLLAELPSLVTDHIKEIEKKRKPIVNYKKQIDSLKKRVERLKELYIAGEIGMEEYKADKLALLEKIENLEKPQDTLPDAPESLYSLKGIKLDKIYGELTQAEKRRFWRGIIKDIYFYQDRSVEVVFL